MKRGARQAQRLGLRFPCSLDLQGSKLASLGIQEPEAVIRGRIENISQGGICLLSSQRIPASSLVRCEIEVSMTRAAIPTLMHVRWAERTSAARGRYKMGLQFLL